MWAFAGRTEPAGAFAAWRLHVGTMTSCRCGAQHSFGVCGSKCEVLVQICIRRTSPDVLYASCAAQDYNARKVLERGIKGIAHDSNAISVAPPDLYANRFFAFNSNVRPGTVTNWSCS